MPQFELLTQADFVLNSCGRPVPPPGLRHIDLSYIIPYQGSVAAGSVAGPTQGRVANNERTVFFCKGVVMQNDTKVKIKWPNGRFLTQNPLPVNASPFGAPAGRGGNMYTLNEPIAVDAGGRIGVEVSGAEGDTDLEFWGVLRYWINETDANAARAANAGSCIVGYSTPARTPGKLEMMENPIAALRSRDRLLCGPNQNIMAPEFLLGNQCTPETPAGYSDEAFTFFSDAISVAPGASSYDNAIIVQGADDTVVRRFRVLTTYSGSASGIPVVQLRDPSGYSVTGGDLIPFASFNTWFPMFPSLVVRGRGRRIILDVANILAAGSGLITAQIEFDAVKRRKV